MEYCKLSKFPLHKSLFFDQNSGAVFYFHQERLHLSGAQHSINLSAYSKYLSRNIEKAALSLNKDVLALESKKTILHLIGTQSVCLKKVKLKNPILGFFFSDKSSVWDLCVVSEGGIFCYKLEEELKPVLKNTISLNVKSYVEEVALGFLAVDSMNVVNLFSLWGKKLQLVSKFGIGANVSLAPGVQNLLEYVQPELDQKIIAIGRFHQKIYLIALDGFSGTLVLYKKDKAKYNFNLDPGVYNIRVLDNMIILHNFGLQQSTIIDRLPNPILFKINHRGSFELNPTFIQLHQQFSLDVNTQQFFELKLTPTTWVENIENEVDKIVFLLRREKSVEDALGLLKSAISDGKRVEEVFKKIVKTEDNLPVIPQSQVFAAVFHPCSKEPNKFLANSILTYMKELLFANISVEVNIQTLLIRVLIKCNELVLLQDLLLHHILEDCKENAKILIELGRKQNILFGFILGIDMLNRLKFVHLVMDELIYNENFYETMSLLSDRPCPGYDLGKLNKETCDFYTNWVIQEFLKDNIY